MLPCRELFGSRSVSCLERDRQAVTDQPAPPLVDLTSPAPGSFGSRVHPSRGHHHGTTAISITVRQEAGGTLWPLAGVAAGILGILGTLITDIHVEGDGTRAMS